MSDRRRVKQKRQQEVTENPTKEEKAVAKYLRFNVATKEGKLVGMPVQYFIGSDAVNCLLESKWAKKGKSGTLFTTRGSCVDYCNRLLLHGMFHRAARQEKHRDKDKKKKATKEEIPESGKEEEKKTKKDKKQKSKDGGTEKREESDLEKSKTEETKDIGEEKREKHKDGEGDDKEEKKDDAKKKKRKEKRLKLEMVDQQVFKDGNEIYVWIYDPVPFKTFVIGLFLVLGAIGVCLFPLWPPEVRLGVYYLSLSVAGCIGLLFCLCIVRVILFSIIWALTLGRHYFWLLPNLNEDVGIRESFVPLYHHEYVPKTDKSGDAKDKIGDGDDGPKVGDDGDKRRESDAEQIDEAIKSTESSERLECVVDKKDDDSKANSESENDNGYEMVSVEELTTGDEDQPNDESKKDV